MSSRFFLKQDMYENQNGGPKTLSKDLRIKKLALKKNGNLEILEFTWEEQPPKPPYVLVQNFALLRLLDCTLDHCKYHISLDNNMWLKCG